MALKDYAISTVVTAPSPATSGTTLTVTTGHGTRFGATPFYATLVPEGQLPTLDTAEKVQVTGISGDTLTIVRARGDTTAKTVTAGWLVVGAVFQKDVTPTEVTVATAAATAAKVGSTAAGNYSPEYGDRINVTFSSGMNVNTATINIDGSGAKNIRVGGANVSTSLFSTTSAVTVPMWYDGTYFQLYGSYLNTTYSEISDANLQNTAGTSSGLITGRRMEAYKNANLIIDQDDMSSDLATKMPSQQSVKAYVDARAGSSWTFNETPSGTIDGTNPTFTLVAAPTNLLLTVNGIAQKPGAGNDYTLSGSTITFLTGNIPVTGSNILATYTTGTSSVFLNGSNGIVQNGIVSGTQDGTNKVFTTGAYIGGSLEVYVNGVKQKATTHYTETTPASGVFTLDEAPLSTDIITTSYQIVSSVTGNADTVDGIHASATPTPNQIPVLDANAKIPTSVLPSTGYIVSAGTFTTSTITANNSQTVNVTIPTQTDTSYYVSILASTTGGAYWTFLVPRVSAKSTSQFSVQVWNNNGSNSASTTTWEYIVVRAS